MIVTSRVSLRNRTKYGLRLNKTARRDRQQLDLVAERTELSRGAQTDLCSIEVARTCLRERSEPYRDQTLKNEIVTLGRPARENDLVGSPTDERSDLTLARSTASFAL